MEYTVEEISPVKKKVQIKVPAKEIEAAIGKSAASLKNKVQIAGFRKGKVPLAVVEKRFHDEVYEEAAKQVFGDNMIKVIEELGVEPAGPIRFEGVDKALDKTADYEFGIEFDCMPVFELPPYEGLEVEESKPDISAEALQRLYERFLSNFATYKTAEGPGPAKAGQVVEADIEAFENGQPVPDFQLKNYRIEIGGGQSPEPFEDLLKTIPLGHTGEGPVEFAKDIPMESVAGKTLDIKATVNSIKDKFMPEVTEEFLEKLDYKSIDELKDAMRDNYLKSLANLYKSETQAKLATQMLKTCQFELPQSLVDVQARLLLGDYASRLEQQGKTLASLGKKYDELLKEFQPQAEESARRLILLLAIAKKENLNVTDGEVIGEIYKNCLRTGEDLTETVDKMEKSGFLENFRDHLLADKAMDLVYSKAKVTYTDPTPGQEETDDVWVSPDGEVSIETEE